MFYTLTLDNVNTILCVEEGTIIVVPSGVFKKGHAVILFNNSDKTTTIQSEVDKTYVSAFIKPRTMIEFYPRGMANLVFVDDDIAVFSGDVR